MQSVAAVFLWYSTEDRSIAAETVIPSLNMSIDGEYSKGSRIVVACSYGIDEARSTSIHRQDLHFLKLIDAAWVPIWNVIYFSPDKEIISKYGPVNHIPYDITTSISSTLLEKGLLITFHNLSKADQGIYTFSLMLWLENEQVITSVGPSFPQYIDDRHKKIMFLEFEGEYCLCCTLLQYIFHLNTMYKNR